MQPIQNILGVLLVASAAVSAVGASAVPAAPAAWAAAPLPHCPSGPALSAALGAQIKPSSTGPYHSKFPGGQQKACSYKASGKVGGTVGVTLWTFSSGSTAKARYNFYWSNAKIAAAHGSTPPQPLPPKRFGTGFSTKSTSTGGAEYWLYVLVGRTLAALYVHVPAASLAEAETAMLDVVR